VNFNPLKCDEKSFISDEELKRRLKYFLFPYIVIFSIGYYFFDQKLGAKELNSVDSIVRNLLFSAIVMLFSLLTALIMRRIYKYSFHLPNGYKQKCVCFLANIVIPLILVMVIVLAAIFS